MDKDEFMYKMNAIIEYLKKNGGYEYKIYNHICPYLCDNPNSVEPDSNIVEYAEDVIEIYLKEISKSKKEDDEFPF